MLTEHHIVYLPDKNGGSKLTAEVNWRDDDEIKECKVIKFTFPDGKSTFVEKKYLHEFLFAIGKPDEQRKMIPQTIRPVHNTTLEFELQATKDIKKGEKIRTIRSVSIECPLYQQEVIGDIRADKDKKKVALTG